MKSAIFGIEGVKLTAEERNFFAETNPFGFILFGRNIINRSQIKSLVSELKEATGRDNLPILIDQEGGRVSRLKEPNFKEFPPAEKFFKLAEKDIEKAKQECFNNSYEMAKQLADLDITVNCAPVADILYPITHDVIGNRAFGDNVKIVSMLASECAKGLLAGGVYPIIKHIPGHGRATVDSHKDLPIVKTSQQELEQTDFAVFKNLKEFPFAMTAHIIYESIDSQEPATTSPAMLKIIREYIGYKGIIMTDDLSMKALKGSMTEKTIKSLESGCDLVLHCNGKMDEMKEIAANCYDASARLVNFHTHI